MCLSYHIQNQSGSADVLIMYSTLPTDNKVKRSGQTFSPVADYANPPESNYNRNGRPKDDWYHIEFGPGLKYHRDLFVQVICAEDSLRAAVQRVEMVKKRVKALEKAATIENNKTQLVDWEKELEQLQRKCWKQELKLYDREQMIPEWPLKQNYDLLRESGTWYMRKELAKDCADRGEYGHLGSNVGYFYFGITIFVLVFTFLFVPETARLTLEQIDEFFLSGKRAWRTSTKKNIAIARGDLLDSANFKHEDSGPEKNAKLDTEHREVADVCR
ncbi:uncharacterized protein N7458_012753 [Penicillium daleae]|uniref:Uncharacterized protein n=1 Tax=Penicillium daleae TaxID=63821 RepID=A0AAD6BVF4_9EURO|nr:uncharacterized protein N7458_012753 [Penicillium daleae]KAJ5433597.1 hypothetical protein N7458_012753 [Penicillium daleae]